jgi:hypothetical protein
MKRIVFFLAIMSSLSMFLYGIGTAQDFLESTQMLLLRLAAALGLLLSIGSTCGFSLDLGYTFIERSPRFLLGAFAYIFAAALGISVTLFSHGILVLVAGNLS